jgi:hypothetical protein
VIDTPTPPQTTMLSLLEQPYIGKMAFDTLGDQKMHLLLEWCLHKNALSSSVYGVTGGDYTERTEG